jgi:ribonuclease HI
MNFFIIYIVYINTYMTNIDIMNKFITKYRNVQKLNTFAINTNTIQLFTDGSCTKNGTRNSAGGFSIIFVSGYKKNTLIFGKVPEDITPATNIRAEGIAILTALDELYSDKENKDKWSKAIIYTDSEFWINMIYDWMPNWDSAKFESRANPDITVTMWKIWNKINKSKNISVKHVYAHNKDARAKSDDPYKLFTYHNNDLADMLASIARELPDFDVRKIHI